MQDAAIGERGKKERLITTALLKEKKRAFTFELRHRFRGRDQPRDITDCELQSQESLGKHCIPLLDGRPRLRIGGQVRNPVSEVVNDLQGLGATVHGFWGGN